MSATMDLDHELSSETDATTSVLRKVQFACPSCGEDRTGVHVDQPGAREWVECAVCTYRCDAGVLEIPTEAMLAEWHAHALRHARAALRCADGSPSCSYLAIVWCRRLAPELSLWGKTSFLDTVTRPLTGSLTRDQREVVLQLGVGLQMPATAINRFLDTV